MWEGFNVFNNALFFFNHSGCYDSTAKIVFTFIYLSEVQNMTYLIYFNSCHFHHRVPSSILRSHNNLFSRNASFSWGCCNCAIRDRELCTEFYYIEFISQITEAENEKGDKHLSIAKISPLWKTTNLTKTNKRCLERKTLDKTCE